MLYGIDCASHQGYPNWSQLKAEGHSFMVTKVTGEGNYVNPYWALNHDRARAAGLVPGTYDWVEPQCPGGWRSGADAARDYYRVVGSRDYGSLLTVDFETPEWANGPMGRNIEAWFRQYCYTLKELARKPVIIYSAPYFMRETGAERWGWLAEDFLYWMAAPGNASPGNQVPDSAPWPGTVTGPWQTVTIHQHQWFATSSAVVGHFDRNRYQGSLTELAGLAGLGEQGDDVKIPAPGKWTAEVVNGEAVFVWNMGGQTDEILGVAIQDIGMTVASATDPNTQVSRSIQDDVVQDFHESPRQPQ